MSGDHTDLTDLVATALDMGRREGSRAALAEAAEVARSHSCAGDLSCACNGEIARAIEMRNGPP